MKKLIVTAFLMVATFVLVSCVEISTVKSIELNWTPKVEFVVGEEVELDDKVVTVNFDDNSSQDFAFSNSAIEKVSGVYQSGGTYYLDTRAVGEYSFRIRYEDSMISIQYNVSEEVTSVEVGTYTDFKTHFISDGTSAIEINLTQDIVITENLTATRLVSIITDTYELDLNGKTLQITTEGQPTGIFSGASLTMSGAFIDSGSTPGAILYAAAFKNSQSIDYTFDVSGSAEFDTVFLSADKTNADIHDQISNEKVSVILLDEGTYEFVKSGGFSEDHGSLVILRSLIMIGKTNSLGEPLTVFQGDPDENYMAMVIQMPEVENQLIINNVHFTGFSTNVYTSVPANYWCAYTGTLFMNSSNFGTAFFDNIIVDDFPKNGITVFNGTMHLTNSIIDYSADGFNNRAPNNIQISDDGVAYISNNYIMSSTSTSVGWSAGGITVSRGGTLMKVVNNHFLDNENAISILNQNFGAEDSKYHFVPIAEGVFEGNVFISNGYNIHAYTNLGLWSGDEGKQTQQDLIDTLQTHAGYPLMNDYNNLYNTNIRYSQDGITLTQDVTVDNVILAIGEWNSDVTLTVVDAVVTLGDHGIIVLYDHDGDGTTEGNLVLNGSASLEYEAWYWGIYEDENAKIYVGSLDLIPEGIEYTLAD